tara:strand:- start:85 stop:240 length:156 start_codon:yes stop_codon:yes gene_type:complete
MSKKAIEKAKNSPMGKKTSHGGKLPLVESLTNKGCMVRPKVRKAQERRRGN